MKIKLGVIFGGVSVEHEVSVISALQAMRSIDTNRYDVIAIYITKDGEWYVVTENTTKMNIIFVNGDNWNGDANQTVNIENITKEADIVITALGVPEFLKANMIKDGAVIVDVGITRVTDNNHPKGYIIKGDVAFDEVSKKASWITPVPGGVGPMTIAMLMKNTLIARERKMK